MLDVEENLVERGTEEVVESVLEMFGRKAPDGE